jgi:hypothetical protein
LIDSTGEAHVTTSRLFALAFGGICVVVDWFHNCAHILLGASGLAASPRTDTARIWAVTIGTAYAFLSTKDFLGTLPLNDADTVLHLASAVLALVMGFTPLGLRYVGQLQMATV